MIVAGFALVARLSLTEPLLLPRCWFREFTGIPCPTCGCTRSLAAWTRLDPVAACQFNPLFFLACLAWLGWVLWRVMARFTGRTLRSRGPGRLNQWPFWILGLVLLALNWVYLCLELPK